MAITCGLVLLIPFIYDVGAPLLVLLVAGAWMIVTYRRNIRAAVKAYAAQLPEPSPQIDSRQVHSLINSLDDIIFEFNEDKVCLNVWFNEFKQRVVDPRSLVGKKIEDILSPEKAEKFNRALDYVITNRKPTSLQYPSDYGTGRWLNAKLTPVFDHERNYTHRISASVADITEQMLAAEALKEKESLLIEAQTVAKIGNWLFDAVTRHTYLSDNLFSILEIDRFPEDIDQFAYYLSLVHPDDKETCGSFLQTIAVSEGKEHEHKLITPTGNLKYIRIIIGNKVLNADGSVKRIAGVIQDITDIKLSEKAIRKGRTELIEAQTIAKIGNWSWDIPTVTLTFSEEISNIFEADPTALEFLGIKRFLLKYVHKNDKFIVQHLFKSAAHIPNYTCVFRIVTPDDAVKYLSVIVGKVLFIENGAPRKVIGTLQDVTDRKRVEIDYKRTENKYKLVLETIKLAAISLDNNGYVTFCNQHLANMLGYTQKEIVGMHWCDNFIPEELRTTIGDMLTHNAIPSQHTNPIICRNDEQRIISWQNTMTYDENGILRETTAIGEDITDQQKATLELISAKELAEKSSKFKSDFLSIMSHEIRTPMNAVIGTTNLLLIDSPRPEQMEYLNILKFSGENLLAIINDILDYNKIEAGKLELNELKFNIHTLAQKIKQTFSAKAAEKKLVLDLSIDESIPELLNGDQIRLSQILNNLISNAVKFTFKGHIDIALKLQNEDQNQVTVLFTVNDTGVGIAPENLAMIFDPFTQEPTIIDNDHGGTGLGLAITKRLINLHNSDITVESTVGKGTLFSFTITFNRPNDELNKELLAAPVNAMLNLEGMKLLIVDDNKMNLLIASRFLKKWKAEVDEAQNGQIAVDMANSKTYDLIIMDLQMPVMDGFEATRAIKKLLPLLPIIALTADAMPETYDKALAAGMSDYLSKPFVPGVLFDKVSRFYKQ
ncbi:PAS domain-containing hybrid sensor histidine kinase/response regulator [Mucilaginibacter sp. dw_454]|uniref:PAS domain-containing hybrid sensor histidine kinase/response regulator n=1 Tax=Mucilaginibacter sp. dw_454 TaxID=2720079 RepID=UPI001BD3C9EA|nr:PAS domain-containing hybrid sensor histidine kinase/response regulator [Mucilaginibacter sp. dw_454]